MVISTIEDAEKWMLDNAQILGAAYVLRDPETEQLLRAYGGYLEAQKQWPDTPCVGVFAGMLIGAINVTVVNDTIENTRKALIAPLVGKNGGAR